MVDDHITGVVSEHQAGKVLGWPDTGIRNQGPPLHPQAAISRSPSRGWGWGGTDITDPLTILGDWNPKKGRAPPVSPC